MQHGQYKASRFDTKAFRQRDRTGAVLTTGMLFVLPCFVYISLAMMQVILLKAAKEHVEAATVAACEFAARGGGMTDTHQAAGLVLAFLGGDYKTEREYLDEFNTSGDPTPDGSITANGDRVAVGVTLPMGLVSTNYLGLLGVGVNDLRIRCVLITELSVTPSDTSCPP